MSAMKGVQFLFFSKKVSVPVVLQKSKLFLVNSDREGCEVGSWSAILALREESSVLKSTIRAREREITSTPLFFTESAIVIPLALFFPCNYSLQGLQLHWKYLKALECGIKLSLAFFLICIFIDKALESWKLLRWKRREVIIEQKKGRKSKKIIFIQLCTAWSP